MIKLLKNDNVSQRKLESRTFPRYKKSLEFNFKNPGIQGTVMFALLLLGYFVFALNWTLVTFANNYGFSPGTVSDYSSYLGYFNHIDSGNLIKGSTGSFGMMAPKLDPSTGFQLQDPRTGQPIYDYSAGIIYQWFPDGSLNAAVTRAPNWTIAFMRGVGSFLAGYAIAKFGHKWAVEISFALMILSFPVILSTTGALQYSAAGYAVFIVFRMILTIGATVLIVYIQPIILRFFFTQKAQSRLQNIAVLPYTIAVVIVNILFTNNAIIISTVSNWQYIQIAFLILSIGLFLVYFFFGKNFNPEKERIQAAIAKQQTLSPKVTLWTVLKQKRIIIWCSAEIFMNYLLNEFFTNSINQFWLNSPNNLALAANHVDLTFVYPLFNIMFVIGAFVGVPLFGSWLKTNYSQKNYLALFTLFGLVCIAIAIGIGYNGFTPVTIVFIMILSFLASTFIYGTGGITAGLPYHWYNVSEQELGHMYAASWGIMFFGYTVLDIITFLILDASQTVGVIMMFVFCLPSFLILLCPKEKDQMKFDWFKSWRNKEHASQKQNIASEKVTIKTKA